MLKTKLIGTILSVIVIANMLTFLGVSPVLATGSITISGTVKYFPMGDSSKPAEPVRNAKVEIWDEEIYNYPVVGWQHLPWPDNLLRTIYTDENGYFSCTLDNNDGSTIIGDEGGRDIFLKVFASNSKARVISNIELLPDVTYKMKTETKKNVSDGAVNFGDFCAADADINVAFEIFTVTQLGWHYVKDTLGIDLPGVRVFFNDPFCFDNSYCLPDPIVTELIANPEMDVPLWLEALIMLQGTTGLREITGIHLYRDHMYQPIRNHETILHEYGHFVHANIADLGPPFPTNVHYIDTAYNPEHAFVEGFAEFFASAVRKASGYPYPYYLSIGGNANIDTLSYTGDSVEGAVAAALWDIHDKIPLSFAEMVRAIQKDPNLILSWPVGADAAWNIYDFFESYRTTHYGDPSIAGIWQILYERGITIPDSEPPTSVNACTASFTKNETSDLYSVTFTFKGATDNLSGVRYKYLVKTYYWEIEEGNLVYTLFDSDLHFNNIPANEDYYIYVMTEDGLGNTNHEVNTFGPFMVLDLQATQMTASFVDTFGFYFMDNIPTDPTAPEKPSYPGKDTEFYLPFQPLLTGSSFMLKSTDINKLDIILLLDNTAPAVTLLIGQPKYSVAPTYINALTSFEISATDEGSGVAAKSYRVTSASYDSGSMTYYAPFTLGSLVDGEYNLAITAEDMMGNSNTINQSIIVDNTSPSLECQIDGPSSSVNHVINSTTFSLITDDGSGSGIQNCEYRIIKESFDSGWQIFSVPFVLPGQGEGAYLIQARAMDWLNNTVYTQIEIINDNIGPLVSIITPPDGSAVQDEVTFEFTALDVSGVQAVNSSFRVDDGGSGISTGFEAIPAAYVPSSDKWVLSFDTQQLPDGYYIVYVEATDSLGNKGSFTGHISIRNWAITQLLPSSEKGKAGRTMPVKFSLSVKANVDPDEPFIYNEDLEIRIYQVTTPSNVLMQTSRFGVKSTDYRISTDELYITNFKTLDFPATYLVEICRDGIVIDSFSFKTTK